MTGSREDDAGTRRADVNRVALSQLALRVVVGVERAPGIAERRLMLLRAFGHAHQLNPAVPEDPDIALLDSLLQHPDRLLHTLEALWTTGF
ncbi:hypothetical protein [Candidatus Nitrospira bockiana]